MTTASEMTTTHDAHATPATSGLWPPTESPRPDVHVDRPEWGDVNRELLAEKLAAAFYAPTPVGSVRLMTPALGALWLRVADAAVDEILGASPAR